MSRLFGKFQFSWLFEELFFFKGELLNFSPTQTKINHLTIDTQFIIYDSYRRWEGYGAANTASRKLNKERDHGRTF